MRLVESRSTLTVSYVVLGIGAFTALFPIRAFKCPAPPSHGTPAGGNRKSD